MKLLRRSFMGSGATAAVSLCISPKFAAGQPVPPDPWTAAAACAALASGALNYIGGAVLQSAIGAPKISDVHTWIIEAVHEIESFITAVIEQAVLAQMTSDLTGAKTKLEEYAALTDTTHSQDLLTFSDDATSRLVPLALQYDRALFVAFAAQSYRLLTLQARYKADGQAGHIISEYNNMDNFLLAVMAMAGRIATPMSPLEHIHRKCVTGDRIIPDPRNPAKTIEVHTTSLCFYVDNDMLGIDCHLNECQGLHQDVENDYNSLAAPWAALQKAFWAKVLNLYSLNMQCYDGMCRQVGKTYTSPTAR